MLNAHPSSQVNASGTLREAAGEALSRRIQHAAGQFMHAWSLVGARHASPTTPDRVECDKVKRRDETPSEVFIG